MHRAGGAGHAALGPRPGRGADPGAALLRPPDGPLRAQAPAGEVRRDRGALADPAAGQRGADRLPDEASERNLFAIEIPKLGSFIASGNWTAREIGLETFPREDRPPVLIPFFGFRIMVGMGLIMLGGLLVRQLPALARPAGDDALVPLGARSCRSRPASSPSCAGWFTAEVGRQPWVVYGLLRTKDAVTPSLTTGDVLFSLAGYVLVYAVIYSLRHLSTSTGCCATGRPQRREAIRATRPPAGRWPSPMQRQRHRQRTAG